MVIIMFNNIIDKYPFRVVYTHSIVTGGLLTSKNKTSLFTLSKMLLEHIFFVNSC